MHEYQPQARDSGTTSTLFKQIELAYLSIAFRRSLAAEGEGLRLRWREGKSPEFPRMTGHWNLREWFDI